MHNLQYYLDNKICCFCLEKMKKGYTTERSFASYGCRLHNPSFHYTYSELNPLTGWIDIHKDLLTEYKTNGKTDYFSFPSKTIYSINFPNYLSQKCTVKYLIDKRDNLSDFLMFETEFDIIGKSLSDIDDFFKCLVLFQ